MKRHSLIWLVLTLMVAISFSSCTRSSFFGGKSTKKSTPSPSKPPEEDPKKDKPDTPDQNTTKPTDTPDQKTTKPTDTPPKTTKPPGSGTGDDDNLHTKDGHFYRCDPAYKTALPIYVQAYDLDGFQDAIWNDHHQCIKPRGDGNNDFNGCQFIQNQFHLVKTPERFLSEFCMKNFDVSHRDWKAGFPKNDGSGDVVRKNGQVKDEWFALFAYATLNIKLSGAYRFKLVSDDGAVFEIGNKVAVETDGLHSIYERTGGGIQLGEGAHKIRMRYFQGPRYRIALQLYWSRNGGPWRIIPTEAFQYVKDIEKNTY